ncbi:MAG: NAD(P)-dependent oxidoreductase [Thermoguttaceae bacterium]
MSENLVVCFKESPVESPLIDRIHDAWPEVDIVNVGQNDIAAALLEADYFCGHAKVPVDWDSIVAQKRLQWIQSSAAGMDWCLVPSIIESDIAITTASGVLAPQVAEHTLSLILSWMRNIPTFLREQHTKSAPDYRKFIRRPTRDLTDRTVGIIGFGGVGRRIARALAPFRTKILAVDLYPTGKSLDVSELWYPTRINELLHQSDVVILCLPLNSQTRGMFDASLFAQMKPDALFVNVARGGLVVTDDLVAALRENKIAGAVCDVTSPEPLPPKHPLWNFDNVIITPHVGGQFYRRFDSIVDIFVENVSRWKRKRPLINFLTKEGKYLGFPIRCTEYPLWIDLRGDQSESDTWMSTTQENRRELNSAIFAEKQSDSTTRIIESTITQASPGTNSANCLPTLRNNYFDLLDQQTVHWNESIHFKELLGRGGQGLVFHSERRGTDGFDLPIAIKVFSPERFANDRLYEEEMCYMAKMAAKLAKIQHDHLLAVHNWRSVNRIRFMEMELVDGFDISHLLRNAMLDHLKKTLSPSRWKHVDNVVVTHGPDHPRLMPGIAIPIIRGCLAALGALHREGIVHGDIKPSNIMLKRTGNTKVVDIGSAFEIEDRRHPIRPFTLAYASPEALEGKEITPRSDIASLGYVLIEMLSGRRLFGTNTELKGLDGRLLLANQLHRILPETVASSETLMKFCKSLVAPDPNKRFENAEAADLFKDGAAEFQRQLVKGDLSCEYETEIRNWLDDLEDYKSEN